MDGLPELLNALPSNGYFRNDNQTTEVQKEIQVTPNSIQEETVSIGNKYLPKSLFKEQYKKSWENNPEINAIIDNDPIIERIIQTESSNDPNAESRVGAQGLMQIMKNTAKDPGFGVSPISEKDRLDPVKNVRFGSEYFSALRNKFGGDDKLALMAYNWGYGNVRKWIAGGSDPKKIPNETVGYLEKILGPETTMEEPMGMASLDIEDEITVSNQGGRVERDPYNNYNTQRTI